MENPKFMKFATEYLPRLKTFFVCPHNSDDTLLLPSNEQEALIERACSTLLPKLLRDALEVRMYLPKNNDIKKLVTPPVEKGRRYWKMDVSKECVKGFEKFWCAGAQNDRFQRGTVVILQRGDPLSPEIFKDLYWGGIWSGHGQILQVASSAALNFALEESGKGLRAFLISACMGIEWIDIFPPRESLFEDLSVVRGSTKRIPKIKPIQNPATSLDKDRLLEFPGEAPPPQTFDGPLREGFLRIDNRIYPIGEMTISIKLLKRKSLGLEMSLVSVSNDDSFGGVALNGLHIPKVKGLDDIRNQSINFSSESDDSSSELGESVFWKANHAILEIETISINMGPIVENSVRIRILANCLENISEKVTVELLGQAQLSEQN